MVKIILAILFVFANMTISAEAEVASAKKEQTTSDLSPINEPRPVIDIAYDLTQRLLKPEEWNRFVKKFESQFKDWENENSGDMNRFLDDRLLQYLLSLHNELGTCSENDLRQLVYWLALYKEIPGVFAPSWILKTSPAQREDMEKLLDDFSWEKLDVLIKNPKRKKKDEASNSGVSKPSTETKVERAN